MAQNHVVSIEVRADADQARRGITAIADDVARLGEDLGGELGRKAQAAAASLRALGEQESALQTFLRLRDEVKGAEDNLARLQAEVVRYSSAIGSAPSAEEKLHLDRLQKEASEASRALEGQRANLQTAQQALRVYGVSADDAGRKLVSVQAAIQRSAQTIAEMHPALARNVEGWRGVHTEAGRLPQLMQRVGSAMQGAMRNVSGLLDNLRSKFGALVDLQIGKFSIGGLVDSIQHMQELRVALTAVTGSAEEAGRQFEFVKRVARSAGTDVGESAQHWMKLYAATKGTALEGKAAQEVFAAVTTAMANMGRSSGETGAVLQTLTQIINGEDVSARQLERTLGTQLPGALQAAAKGFGITESALRKMIDSGEVTAEKMLPALAKGLNETVNTAPLAAKVSDAFQNVKNAFADFADMVGQAGVSQALVTGANIATAAIQGFAAAVVYAGKVLGIWAAALRTLDFSSVTESFREAGAEFVQTVANAAQSNEVLRAALEKLGGEAGRAALAEAETATKAQEAGNAAASAAPKLAALGMSYKDLEKEISQVQDTASLELEVIKERIKAAEAEAAQEGLTAEAKLAAHEKLAAARKAEMEHYNAILAQKEKALQKAQEELAASIKASEASEEEANRLAPVIDNLKTLVLMREKDVLQAREQVKAYGEEVKALGKVSAEASKAVESLDSLIKTARETGMEAQKAGQAIEKAFASAIPAADSLAAVDELRRRLLAAKEAGMLSEQAFERLGATLDDMAHKAAKLSEVERAMKELGVTSQNALKEAADKAQANFATIRDSGVATVRELREAWQAMAEAQIAANGGVADSALEAQAAQYGLLVQTNEVGQSVIVTMEAAAEASMRAGDAARYAGEQAAAGALVAREAAAATREAGDAAEEVASKHEKAARASIGTWVTAKVAASEYRDAAMQYAKDTVDAVGTGTHRYIATFSSYFRALDGYLKDLQRTSEEYVATMERMDAAQQKLMASQSGAASGVEELQMRLLQLNGSEEQIAEARAAREKMQLEREIKMLEIERSRAAFMGDSATVKQLDEEIKLMHEQEKLLAQIHKEEKKQREEAAKEKERQAKEAERKEREAQKKAGEAAGDGSSGEDGGATKPAAGGNTTPDKTSTINLGGITINGAGVSDPAKLARMLEPELKKLQRLAA